MHAAFSNGLDAWVVTTTHGNVNCRDGIVYQTAERLNYCRRGFESDGAVISSEIIASTPEEAFAMFRLWYATSDCSGNVLSVTDASDIRDVHSYGRME